MTISASMEIFAAGSVITSPSTSTSPALISLAAYERGTSKLCDTALSNLKVSLAMVFVQN